MIGRRRFGTLRRKVALGFAITATALSLIVPSVVTPVAVFADGGQSDPAWDYGRGGSESPGNPACYMPAPDQTRMKMYNVFRPSCFSHMQ